MNKKNLYLIALMAPALLFPNLAYAHTYGALEAGFFHGLIHPFGGLDHLLAMIAVGLWAAQIGGRALWLIPMSFVVMMVGGSAIGMVWGASSHVELGIIGSLLVLGTLVATSWRLSTHLAVCMVGLFAVFHGIAHGAEIPQASTPALYGMGFVLATISLHGLGMMTALFSNNTVSLRLARMTGGIVMIFGLTMIAGY